MAAFIDVEHALDPSYAKKLGVDVDNLLVSQPDFGEQALEITAALIASGSIDVLVVDSVAALVPKAELDGEMGDSFVGVHARLMEHRLNHQNSTAGQTDHANLLALDLGDGLNRALVGDDDLVSAADVLKKDRLNRKGGIGPLGG